MARAILVAAAAAAALATAAPTALAAAPATDEYTLDLPGVRDSNLSGAPDTGGDVPAQTDQAGVTGETAPATASPLDSLLSAIGEAPIALAAALLLTLILSIAAGLRPRPPRTG